MFKKFLFLISLISCLNAMSWSDVINIASLNSNIQTVDIAINNSNGEAVAVWDTFDGTDYSIQYSYSSNALQTWSSPVTLSENGERVDSPKIAITADGKVVIIYRKLEANYFRIMERHSLDNFLSWSNSVYLSDVVKHAYGVDIALTSLGDAVVTWIRGNQIEVSKSSSDFSTWNIVCQTPDTQNYLSDPKIIVNDADEVVLCWKEFDFFTYMVNEVHSSANLTTWSSPNKLSGTGNDVQFFKVAKNGNDVVVVFSRNETDNPVVQEIHSLNNLTSWSTIRLISETGQVTYNPDILSSRGGAYVVWQKWYGANYQIQLTKSLDLTNWSVPLDLSVGSDYFFEPKIYFHTASEAVTIWKHMDDARMFIQESDSSSEMSIWSAPIDLSEMDSSFSEIMMTSNNNNKVLAYWMKSLNNQMVLQMKHSQ